MSITINCEFSSLHEAKQAAARLHRRGYMVSLGKKPVSRYPVEDPLLVAYPYGYPGGNSSGNNLMASMPPMSGNGVLLHTPETGSRNILSVLTDDTEAREARQLLTALGGRIL